MVFVLSYVFIPHSFDLEGGSCYQGTTPLIIRFFLTICGILSFISLITNYFSRFEASKGSSIISLLIWLIWSLFFISNTFVYFIPFLILNAGIVWWSFKAEKR